MKFKYQDKLSLAYVSLHGMNLVEAPKVTISPSKKRGR